MAFIPSMFTNGFRYALFLFLLHLGCFFFPSSSAVNDPKTQLSPCKRRKISPVVSSSTSPPTSSSSSSSSSSGVKAQKSLSVKSYVFHLLSFRKPGIIINGDDQASTSIPTPTSPTPPLALSPAKSPSLFVEIRATTHVKRPSFTSRADVHPCLTCGEVMPELRLLDLHHATKHSLSLLSTADSGKNIIEMIFRSGWPKGRSLTIQRILKIQNTAKTIARFEEYREMVRARAARRPGGGDERCMADGNERLRFYCTTALCSMGTVGVCGSQYCSACGIVRCGFSGKHADLEGIPTRSTSWGAHAALPEELEEEFGFLRVKRVMVVCRVVAGRVARGGAGEEEDDDEEKGKGGFDSVVVVGPEKESGARSTNWLGGTGGEEEEELLVFNARALLPCFLIIYNL
ncbi:hypothetical protein DsansV1_C17g0148681 [Dioscorea sansibarensis]